MNNTSEQQLNAADIHFQPEILKRSLTFTQKTSDLKILVAPSGFKESLGTEEVADCIEIGLRRALPEDATIRKIPLHDGGEGFARALTKRYNGDIIHCRVIGPIGQHVEAYYGILHLEGDKIAAIDMASAAGLRLVPNSHRNPTKTTTYGVGELIAAALSHDVTRVIVGCGDSGTSDGGVGMLQALGIELYSDQGPIPIASGGATLADLKSIDRNNLHPKLKEGIVKLEAVCNIKNVLCGPHGVAKVYGPQKGATPDQVTKLSAAMDLYASIVSQHLDKDISFMPGSGASGGLGAGLLLLGGSLNAREIIIPEIFNLETLFEERWDFLITAEGSIDWQSSNGKMTVGIASEAKKNGTQVIALAGTIGSGADICYSNGIGAFMSILKAPSSLAEAIINTEKLLIESAERAMRMIIVGMKLEARKVV